MGTRHIFNPFNGQIQPISTTPAQTVTVGKAGCDYSTIQAAIDAITDASINKQYLIQIYPGVYSENVTIKSYIHLQGIGTGVGVVAISSTTTPFTGTIQEDAVSAFSGIQFICTPTTDSQSCVSVTGAHGYLDCFFLLQTSSNIAYSAVVMNGTVVYTMATCSIQVIDSYTNSNKVKRFFEVQGSAQNFFSQTTVRVTMVGGSADHSAVYINSTGFQNISGLSVYYQNSSSFSGTVAGVRVATASTETRTCFSGDIRLLGTSGGTAYGVSLESASAATFLSTGMSMTITGFTNEYSANASSGNVQKLWLNSVNKDLPKTGAGLCIVTPYDALRTGFVDWVAAGSTYWSYDVGTRVFSVSKAGVGVVKDSPVAWAAGSASPALTNFVTNYIYVTSAGALASTTTRNAALYENNIVLFAVYSDGTNTLVTKENHPYKFAAAVSEWAHDSFGSVLKGTGAVVTKIGDGSTRTISIVGADTLQDHGLNTTISDSSGAAVNWTVVYTGASGTTLVAAASAIPGSYNNGTSLTDSNKVVVYRLGVLKETLNSSSPQYVARPHTAVFNNVSEARTAANANNVAQFDATLSNLEVAQLGFAIITGTGTGGGGTLNETISAPRTISASYQAAAAATSAGLVNTTVTNFDRILSSADTSVQLALDTLDNGAVKGETGDIIHTSFTLANNQSAAANVTGLVFSGASVRAFRAQVSVFIDATADLVEEILLEGCYTGADWLMSQSGTGNDSLVTFSITSAGQVRYTTPNYAGFSSGVCKFRAFVTLV